MFLAGYLWFVAQLFGTIPTRKELRAFSSMATANVLYDIADREVFTIAKEQRIEVPLSQMSPDFLKAVIGKLLNWDRVSDLEKITVPTLVIGAQYDTMDPKHMEMMAKKVKNGQYLY